MSIINLPEIKERMKKTFKSIKDLSDNILESNDINYILTSLIDMSFELDELRKAIQSLESGNKFFKNKT